MTYCYYFTHLANRICCEICTIQAHTNTWSARIHQNDPSPILLPTHHSAYTEPMATKVAELHAVVDTTNLHTYTNPLQLAQAMHGFAYVWDVRVPWRWAVDEGAKDITALMVPNAPNADFKLGRPPTLQANSHTSPQYLAICTTWSSHIRRKKMGSLNGPIKRSTGTSETSWRIRSAY